MRIERTNRSGWLVGVIGVVVVFTALLGLAAVARAESRIVVREGARRVVAVAPVTGDAVTLAKVRHGAVLGTGASADGQLVAFGSRIFHQADGEKVWTDRIWTLRPGGRPRVVRTIVSRGVRRGRNSVNSVVVSPGGTRLLVQMRGGATYVMRADGSSWRRVRPAGFEFGVGEGRNTTRPEFTPDGRRVLGALYPPGAEVTDVGGLGTVALGGGPVHFIRRGAFDDGVGHFLGPTISTDGQRIAYVGGGGRSGLLLKTVNRDGDGARTVSLGLLPGWSIASPAFSPSGRALTFVAEHRDKGNGIVIGKAPSDLFTIRPDGTRLRVIEREKAHLFGRDPTWVRWPRAWGR